MVYISTVAMEMDLKHTPNTEAYQLHCKFVYLKFVMFSVWIDLRVPVLDGFPRQQLQCERSCGTV